MVMLVVVGFNQLMRRPSQVLEEVRESHEGVALDLQDAVTVYRDDNVPTMSELSSTGLRITAVGLFERR
jgi:hypothetical protein